MASQEDVPRALDVQRFAEARRAEICSLEASIRDSGAHWGIKALPRHLRRRATSHNGYVHKRRPNLKLQQARAAAKATGEAGTPCNRAMRRRKARLQQGIVQSLAVGPGASESGKPRMLETHVWHAKRMQMTTRWGHKLAEGAAGKGHGSRAFLHTLRHGTTMHDASYWLTLELSGLSASLDRLLTALCGPEAADVVSARPEAQGLRETEAVLHHPHSYPLRAITPVKILYQNGWEALMEQRNMSADTVQPSRLLLSVYAAAHEEALHAISQAAADCDIAVHPRYDLQRVELTGALSDRAISAALQLADEPALPSLPVAPESQISRRLFCLLRATGGAVGAELPSNAVLRVQVQDPRLAKPIKPLAGVADTTTPSPAELPQLSDYRGELKEARSLAKQLSAEEVSRSIWGVNDVPQPLSEAAVSSYRHQQKLAGLLLQGTPPEPLPEERASCPVLMARQAPKDRQAVPGWTLIIPGGWASHIWQALAYQGARPAGQRERRWTAMQQGEAIFPHDYPDTLAYAQLAAELAAEQDAYRSLRPKGRCPEGTPHPPRWDLLGASVAMSADSSQLRPQEAPAPETEAVAASAMSLDAGQPREAVSIAAKEAQVPVLDESRAVAQPPPEEAAAMEIDSLAPCPSVSDVQMHPAHAEPQHSSAAAPSYVARTQRMLQTCLQHKPERPPGRHPSTQETSVAGEEAGRRPDGNAECEKSTAEGAKCLVRVSLRTVGPGVLHEGAAILSLSAEEAASIRRSMLGHKLGVKGGHRENKQEVLSLKQALREFHQRQLAEHHPPSRRASQAAPEEPESASAPAAAAAQHARVLIGYVTSEAPRGLLGRGACGVCLEASLAALRAQQTPERERSGVLVAYRSPQSSVLRLAEARLVW